MDDSARVVRLVLNVGLLLFICSRRFRGRRNTYTNHHRLPNYHNITYSFWNWNQQVMCSFLFRYYFEPNKQRDPSSMPPIFDVKSSLTNCCSRRLLLLNWFCKIIRGIFIILIWFYMKHTAAHSARRHFINGFTHLSLVFKWTRWRWWRHRKKLKSSISFHLSCAALMQHSQKWMIRKQRCFFVHEKLFRLHDWIPFDVHFSTYTY